MRLYRSKEHPDHWIGEDEHGVLMIWPARRRGWLKRTAYAGAKRQLEEVESALARGTGWPFGPVGRRPQRGETSRPLTIRVTDTERGAWQRSADKQQRGLSDWVRDTCNGAATDDAKPRSKGRQ
jgi:hypothetical protein